MISKFPYSIVRFESSPSRGERLNVGIVVFKSGTVDFRIEPSFSRQVILREYGVMDEVRRLESTLSFWIHDGDSDGDWQTTLRALSLFPRWKLSAPGCFLANNEEQYESEIRSLLEDLVSPTGSSRSSPPKRRLISDLRSELEKIGLLSSEERDFNFGYVVPKFPLHVGTATLRVDFAAKKGKETYLLQTVDLTVGDGPDKIRDTSYKALMIDQAKRGLSDKIHAVFVVRFAGIEDDSQEVCREIIKAYAASIIDFDNERRRIELLAHLSKLRRGSDDLFRTTPGSSVTALRTRMA